MPLPRFVPNHPTTFGILAIGFGGVIGALSGKGFYRLLIKVRKEKRYPGTVGDGLVPDRPEQPDKQEIAVKSVKID